MAIRGLYLIIDPEQTAGRDARLVAELALRGGVAAIQYRDKLRDKGDQLPIVEALLQLCHEHSVPLIVNDHADLALAAGADGVHVGQHDLPLAAVRRILPAGAVVGVSTNNPQEAAAAVAGGASYVAVGRMFPTSSKLNTRAASLGTLHAVRAAVKAPLVAIGGITAANVDSVIEGGADAAAVIAAVCAADDIELAARTISSRFERAAG